MRTTLHQSVLSGSEIDEQIALERWCIEEGVRKYWKLVEQAAKRGERAMLKPEERVARHWFLPLVKSIRRETKCIAKGSPGYNNQQAAPAFLMLDADRLAVLTLHTAIGLTIGARFGVSWRTACHRVGTAVIAEINADVLRESDKKWAKLHPAKRYKNRYDRPPNDNGFQALITKNRTITTKLINRYAKAHAKALVADDQRLASFIGAKLIWLLIDTAVVGAYDDPDHAAAFVMKPVFRTRKDGTPTRNKIFCMTFEAREAVHRGHVARELMRPRYMPMLIQPLNWQPMKEAGPYINLRVTMIARQRRIHTKRIDRQKCQPFVDGLNALQETPWRTNDRMYGCLEDIYNAGGDRLTIPPRDPLPLPPKLNSTSEEAIKKRKAERAKIHDRNAQLQSLRAVFEQRMMVARKFQGRPFWQAHNADFRGRCYTICPTFSHHGDDSARALLLFDKARPMSDRGRFWLKVHAANMYGGEITRRPFKERAEWTDQHMGEIENCAGDPLSYEWWTSAKKKTAFQFLAACIAIMNPEIGSRMPIQRDATCSGLQHYSAILRDPVGAEAVNVLPSDRRRDVYDDVAQIVRKRFERDSGELAQMLAPVVNRDLCKPNVMTKVYGVTPIGARKQIEKELKKLNFEESKRYEAAKFLSTTILDALAEVAPKAIELMAWLRQTASAIAKDRHAVTWTTPLGFTVIQPYLKDDRRVIVTALGKLSLYTPDENKPRVGKQADSFAPNWIHSIDASHMLMTAIQCRQRDMAFAGVHDSYWTHAEDVDRLDMMLRRTFIKLHQQPLLDMLVKELRERYPKVKITDPPTTGTLDVSRVMYSQHFFE